jgi:hypothetical protein
MLKYKQRLQTNYISTMFFTYEAAVYAHGLQCKERSKVRLDNVDMLGQTSVYEVAMLIRGSCVKL